jgi:site-specific DNA-methyltransferase (adenine-specific)
MSEGKKEILLGDCLELMKNIPNGSIDMILCDLPYGTTACKWDTVIPFEPLWEQYKRVIKDNGAIVLFASQPFTSALIMSNPKMFRYEWIWEKTIATNFMFVKKQPAKKHENILVFYKKQPTYNIQFEEGAPYSDKRTHRYKNGVGCERESIADVMKQGIKKPIKNEGKRYPSTVQKFSNGNNSNVHPTQKPLELMKYLIKIYTNENDMVLDNTMGSGTTGVACASLKRKFIGIEIDKKYFEIAKQRIEQAQNPNTFEKSEAGGPFSFTDEPTKAD